MYNFYIYTIKINYCGPLVSFPCPGRSEPLRAPSIKPCTSGSLEELQVRVHGSTGPRASGSVELTIFVGIYPLVN